MPTPQFDLQPLDDSTPTQQQQASQFDLQPVGGMPQADPNFVQQVWGELNKPLIDVTPYGKQFSDYMSTPVEGESPLWAQTKGFIGGAGEGLSNVVSGFSSPLNLGLMAATGGAGALAESMPETAQALNYAGKALSAPVIGHGAYQAATAPTMQERMFGLTEAAGGAAAMMHSPGVRSISPDVPAPGADMTALHLNEYNQKANDIIHKSPMEIAQQPEQPRMTETQAIPFEQKMAKLGEYLQKDKAGILTAPELQHAQQLYAEVKATNFEPPPVDQLVPDNIKQMQQQVPPEFQPVGGEQQPQVPQVEGQIMPVRPGGRQPLVRQFMDEQRQRALAEAQNAEIVPHHPEDTQAYQPQMPPEFQPVQQPQQSGNYSLLHPQTGMHPELAPTELRPGLIDRSAMPETHEEAIPPGQVPQTHEQATHPQMEGEQAQTHESATSKTLPKQSVNKPIETFDEGVARLRANPPERTSSGLRQSAEELSRSIEEQHYPSTGLSREMNDTSKGPVVKGGIRQPQKEYPGYKGEISNEASVASEATPEDVSKAQGPLSKFWKDTSGEFDPSAFARFAKGYMGKGELDATRVSLTPEELKAKFGSSDPVHTALTGKEPAPGGPGDTMVGESRPQTVNSYIRNLLENNVLTKAANISGKTTRTVLGSHVPGTAISFHGFNEAIRHTLFGETYNPISTATRAMEAIHYLVRPNAANEYLRMNPSLAAEARIAGVRLQTRDIGDPIFKGNNVLTRGFNYLTDPRPLFQQVIPALKVKSFIKLVDNFEEAGIPRPKARALAAEATNNIYGGMNLKMLERNPITQKVWRATMLAPDWMETNYRLGKGMGQSLLNPTNPMHKAYRVGAANFLGAYVTMNVLNAVNNDGKFMFQNDPGHELDVAFGQASDGRVRYWRPFGTAMDMIRIPLELAHSLVEGDTKSISDMQRYRLSEPLQFATDIWSNTNWKGEPIFGRNKYGQQMSLGHQAYNLGSDVMNHFAPAPVSAIADYALGKDTEEEAGSRFFQLPMGYKKPEQPAKKYEKKWKY